MTPNKTKPDQEEKTKPPKRRKRRLFIWLGFDLGIGVLILVLLFHTPAGYTPNTESTDGRIPESVRDYWTWLGVEIYNRAQRGCPFDLIIDQNRVNEAILQEKWPQSSDGVKLFAPTAEFQTGRVQLMGTAEVQGAELILTVHIGADIDPNGSANLIVENIKIGAMNITPVAKLVARKTYQKKIEYMMADPDRIETKILSALLDNQSFDPVFRVRNVDRRSARVRVKALQIEPEQITVRLAPAN